MMAVERTMFDARGTSQDKNPSTRNYRVPCESLCTLASCICVPLATRVQRIQRLTHTQVVVSSVRASLQLADSAAALPHRVEAASLAPRTLVDLARPTRPHKTTLSAAAPQPQAIRLVEATQLPDLARATQPTRDQASHSVEETQLLLEMRLKAPLPLLSSRSPRKMALMPPVLIKVSPCSLSTRTRVSRS